MVINLIINGVAYSFDVKENEYLSDTLRNRHGLKSIRLGCNESSCGSCTVLLDDKPVLSCSILSVRANDHHITTVEGIPEEASKISDYFSKEGADQCGFCNVGFALTIYALKKEYKNPTDEQIKKYVVGNLCRCTGYQSQLLAIKAYLKESK